MKDELYSQSLDGARWFKSSFSNPDNCVEAARITGGWAVRDSKNPDGPVLRFTDGEMDAFARGSAAGEFN